MIILADEYLRIGLAVVEESHKENERVPGFRPKPGDVITYHMAGGLSETTY